MQYESLNPYYRQSLDIIYNYINDNTINEIIINEPQTIIIERIGMGKIKYPDANLSIQNLKKLTRIIANNAGLHFNDMNPKLSCVMPYFRHRFEAMFGASVQDGVSIAIRTKHKKNLTWCDLGVSNDLEAYLRNIITRGDNIIISGATNTGKTTLLNKLINELPNHQRIVAVEDTPEVDLHKFEHATALIAGRDNDITKNGGLQSWENITNHINRISPDNIILGEISTINTAPALSYLNTGNKGFICTIHAESPMQIPNKFTLNMQYSGKELANIEDMLFQLVDTIIQIKRIDVNNKIMRKITDIYHPKIKKYAMKDGVFNG